MSHSSAARILVVTDEQDQVQLPALEGAELEVVRSQPARLALARLKQARFDVVVANVVARATWALALLENIRALGAKLPVLVVTRSRADRLAARVESLGGEVCAPTRLATALKRAVKTISVDREAQRSLTTAAREPGPREDEARLSFRNRRGEQVELATFTATAAKNEFGKVLDAALQRGAVAITRHDAPRAVLLDIEEYRALTGGKQRPLDLLTAQFDEMLERMQTPGARNAVRAAFGASPAELGKAAVAAATKPRG